MMSEIPKDLSIAGEQAWNNAFSQLEERGGYKPVYYHSLYCYCKCVDVIFDGYAQLAEQEKLTVDHENNKNKTNQRKNPTWAVIAEAQTHMREFAKKLGLTPYDESKIPVKDPKEEDELAKLLKGENISVA